ncbi:MAG: PA14 domain-containing protein [Alphaproteobacteria bacterium]|nr:PA14 domain-containing protein [Alphaproteobacteria bacterium]
MSVCFLRPDRTHGSRRRPWLAIGVLAGALLLHGAPSADAAITGLAPADPQPTAEQLKPGLSVKYHYGIFNTIEGMIMRTGGAKTASPGEPLPQLNYKVNFGAVLSSGRQDGVAAFIKGYIRFDKPGSYVFKVQSNDGIRLDIGGQMIFTDPEVHPDTFSEPLPVEISQAGWYPIEVIYFEKRNTSTLELYWKAPGQAGDFAFVPAAAFAHIPE